MESDWWYRCPRPAVSATGVMVLASVIVGSSFFIPTEGPMDSEPRVLAGVGGHVGGYSVSRLGTNYWIQTGGVGAPSLWC